MSHYKTLGLNLSSDWHDLARLALDQGWRVTKTKGNHVKWQGPAGGTVFSASTPGDFRAIRNTRSRLRRLGLKDE